MDKAIRIYDDRTLFLVTSFYEDDEIDLLTELLKDGIYARFEYCTINHETKEYEMYYSTKDNPRDIKKAMTWGLEKDYEYHVFLDTLWFDGYLPKDGTKPAKYGNRTYPGQLNDNLKDDRIKTITVYSAFDPDAAQSLDAALKKHQKSSGKNHFPTFLPWKKLIYTDTRKIWDYLVEPIKPHP